jgi:hypothetical protein
MIRRGFLKSVLASVGAMALAFVPKVKPAEPEPVTPPPPEFVDGLVYLERSNVMYFTADKFPIEGCGVRVCGVKVEAAFSKGAVVDAEAKMALAILGEPVPPGMRRRRQASVIDASRRHVKVGYENIEVPTEVPKG